MISCVANSFIAALSVTLNGVGLIRSQPCAGNRGTGSLRRPRASPAARSPRRTSNRPQDRR